MAGKKKGDGEEKAPGGKKKLIIIGALAAVLLAGGAGGGVFLLTKDDTAAASAEEAHVELVPGEVTTLDAISLNLADGHYLKIGVALQAVEAEAGGHGGSAGPDGSKALDLTIGEFSGLSMADLSNAEQRQHYQDELEHKIIEAYKEKDEEGVAHEVVMGIYFTQFVMQ